MTTIGKREAVESPGRPRSREGWRQKQTFRPRWVRGTATRSAPPPRRLLALEQPNTLVRRATPRIARASRPAPRATFENFSRLTVGDIAGSWKPGFHATCTGSAHRPFAQQVA